MDYKLQYLVDELLILVLEDQASDEQIRALNQYIRTDSEVLEYCADFFALAANLRITDRISQVFIDRECQENIRYADILNQMANVEKTAPAIRIQKTDNSEKELLQKVERGRLTFQIRKSSLISVMAAAAVLLLIILFDRFVPVKTGVEVATLSESINAKWAENTPLMNRGFRLTTSHTPILLKEGLIQLSFDNQTDVVIESPAEFQILTEDQIRLSYGALYARVPKEAIGFAVVAQIAKVIDLGTEFGLKINPNGDTELHVLKGKTLFLAGKKGNKTSSEIHEGYAKRISGQTLAISDIPCNEKLFARGISTQNQVVWRGQNTLNLTDIIAGGDGLNKAAKQTKIDLLTGQYTADLVIPFGFVNPGFKTTNNPFIDGVFIPHGGVNQIISSTGLCFKECPETSSYAFYNISTLETAFEPAAAGNKPLSLSSCPLSLYRNDSSDEGLIFLHANAGITLDLSAIRNHFSGFQLSAFSTHYGFPVLMPDVMTVTYPDKDLIAEGCATVDFYVLVDGVVRQQMRNINLNTRPAAIHVPLSNQDRFLSLVVTDNNRNTLYDWFVLENAKIHIKQ